MKIYRFELLFFDGTVIIGSILGWGAFKQLIYLSVKGEVGFCTDMNYTVAQCSCGCGIVFEFSTMVIMHHWISIYLLPGGYQ